VEFIKFLINKIKIINNIKDGHYKMKAIDCGTGFFVSVNNQDITLQRNAFLTIDKAVTTLRQLKTLNVPYIEINNKLHIIGQKAYEYAQVFGNKDLKRPMAQGLLNPTEQDAFPILREIISGLVGTASQENERIVYCIPGKPIDKSQEIDYHKDVLKQIIESLGYSARAINEATALGLVGLQNSELSGIAISLGAGMVNFAILYAGMSALTFSIAKSGDWIDENVARDCGITKAKAQYIKETGNYTIDPASTQERTREQQAIKTYYEVLFRYLLANLAKQFESSNMPTFPKPIPIIIGGGTASINGFIEVFRDQFQAKQFPLEISEIKIVDEPLTAVARGCYLEAQLEEN
jgi:actin-like ATPase involved in cell morphogenesis